MQRTVGDTMGGFDHSQLATELIGKPEDRYGGNPRANPDHWQADFWRLVYDFNDSDVMVVGELTCGRPGN